MGIGKPYQNIARAHHHNPRSYLGRWTDTGDANGRLYVHDLIAGMEPRPQKPAKCGLINNLYEVFEDGLDRDRVEQWSGINRDGPGHEAIELIEKDRRIPDKSSPHYFSLIEFIAFAGVWSPAFRTFVDEGNPGKDRIEKQNAFVRRMLTAEKEIGVPASYENILQGKSGRSLTATRCLSSRLGECCRGGVPASHHNPSLP